MRSNETSAIVVNNMQRARDSEQRNPRDTNMANLFEEIFTTLFIKQIFRNSWVLRRAV